MVAFGLQGTEATRCIDISAIDLKLITSMRGLENMKKLRLLLFTGLCWNVNENSLRLPNSLRYLCWYYYPYESLPEAFGEDFLVGLDIFSSKVVQLWQGGERKVKNG